MHNPKNRMQLPGALIIFSGILFLASCGKEDPHGTFRGEIKDWVHEVFEAPVIAQGHECQIELILKQAPEGFLAQLRFQHPKMTEVVRSGKWKVDDGYRSVSFSDGKTPSEYFLIKSGARFAFQTKEGLSNDDGSPILLMRNEGKSRKASYPIKFSFLEDEKVQVETAVKDQIYFGSWKWGGDQITVIVNLKTDSGAGKSPPPETYKYFLRWEKEGSENLHLDKMLITRPFLNDDGSRRQSWMSSLVFSNRPLLKPF